MNDFVVLLALKAIINSMLVIIGDDKNAAAILSAHEDLLAAREAIDVCRVLAPRQELSGGATRT